MICLKKHWLMIGSIVILVGIFFIYKALTSQPEISLNESNLLKEIQIKEQLINNLNKKAFEQEKLIDLAVAKSDSLENVKQTVKHHYHETYIGINTYSNKQLDSLLRANW